MFEKKQILPLLLNNAHWQKEKKNIQLQWRNQSYCLVGWLLCFVLLVYQRIKKMIQENQESKYPG